MKGCYASHGTSHTTGLAKVRLKGNRLVAKPRLKLEDIDPRPAPPFMEKRGQGLMQISPA